MQHHPRCVIIVDHPCLFINDIADIVNPRLVSYDTENRATAITSFNKKEKGIIV